MFDCINLLFHNQKLGCLNQNSVDKVLGEGLSRGNLKKFGRRYCSPRHHLMYGLRGFYV
jgi:hypothetical protein